MCTSLLALYIYIHISPNYVDNIVFIIDWFFYSTFFFCSCTFQNGLREIILFIGFEQNLAYLLLDFVAWQINMITKSFFIHFRPSRSRWNARSLMMVIRWFRSARISHVNDHYRRSSRGIPGLSRRRFRYQIVFRYRSSDENSHWLSATLEWTDSYARCRDQTTGSDFCPTSTQFIRRTMLQVSSNAPILFRQASSIGTLEDVLDNMQTRIGSLRATVDRWESIDFLSKKRSRSMNVLVYLRRLLNPTIKS